MHPWQGAWHYRVLRLHQQRHCDHRHGERSSGDGRLRPDQAMNTIDSAASQHDLRQYELMLDRLEAFTRSVISLRKLIEDLRSLVEVLELSSPAWKEAFVSEWWTLEQVYAVALDRDQLDHLPVESSKLIDRAVASLSEMVVGAIDSSHHEADRD